MTRQDLVDSLPTDPAFPIVIMVGDETDLLEVMADIMVAHGTKYIERNEVNILVNSEESRDIIRSTLCLSYIDPSCFNI
jgi:hypothetical protein